MAIFTKQVKYNLLRIIMNFAIKPPSLRKQVETQFTKQQITQNGCCFPLFSNNYQSKHMQESQTYHHYSQPKIKQGKKIDLVIAKKRFSQNKIQQQNGLQSVNKSLANKNQLKNIQNTTNHSSLISKVTTQKNSLKNSRIKLSLDKKSKKVDECAKKQKCLQITTNYNSLIQKPQTKQQTKTEITNIQYLSQISMIEEEFVSHDSTTLNALNFLNRYQFSQSKGYDVVVTPVRYMIDAINQKRKDEINETPNPLKRLTDKKNIGNVEFQRKRLYL